MIRRWLGSIVGILACGYAVAGPVNTTGSYPYAVANARGDRLTLGDLKGLVYWTDHGTERAAAIPWQRVWKREDRFTGGLAAGGLAAGAAAIACGPLETQLFYPERSAAFPAGKWLDAGTAESGARRCAMQKNGDFAEFFADRSLVLINRQQRLSIPAGFQQAELVAAGSGFYLVKAGAALAIIPTMSSSDTAREPLSRLRASSSFDTAREPLSRLRASSSSDTAREPLRRLPASSSSDTARESLSRLQFTWTVSAVWSHAISGVTPDTRFAGNQRGLVKADPDGNAWIPLDGQRFGTAQRLPVNPCEDGQVCGVSVADDDSWVISGYWGHYLGRGQQFVRLNIPLSVDKGPGAVAIAHASATGRFIYLGFDDGDQGLLPGLPKLSRLRNLPERYMLWTRNAERRVHLMLWNDVLPAAIPEDWIAWEPAYEWTIAADKGTPSVADDRWWLDRLEARAAQDFIQRQGWRLPTIHAAVIDSGIDPTHPLLQIQLDRKAQEIPENGLDDDGNGFVDDVWGYDFVEEDAIPQDLFGHGTHVAGLLIGQYPNDSRSPAPNLALTVVRALDRSGKSNSIDLARALLYAADNGAEIINCSWGGGPDTQALRDAFAILHERGVLVFSSAGNDHADTDKGAEIPKTYPGVIAVGATDRQDQLASFSSFGKNSVRFMTPGDAVVSSIPGGGLGEKSGTSMASPLAASSFALVWAVVRGLHPEWSRAEQIAAADRALCSTGATKNIEGRSQCGRLRLLEAVQSLSGLSARQLEPKTGFLVEEVQK